MLYFLKIPKPFKLTEVEYCHCYLEAVESKNNI